MFVQTSQFNHINFFIMNKLFFITLLLLLFNLGYSQDKKSKISLKVGTEYRITPIYNNVEGVFITPAVNYNLDKQLSGSSFNYSLSYFVTKSFEIGFSQSFRYDHIYFKSVLSDLAPSTNINSSSGESVNDWITDYHLFIGKYFDISDNKIFLRLGYSIMNRGTNHTINNVFGIDNQGNYTYLTDQLDFNFFAFNFNGGIAIDRYELGIGAYFISGNSSNFDQKTDGTIILPVFKLSYRLK